MLSDAAMPCPSGTSMSQFLALSAHRGTADSGGGGGVASTHSQAPHGHLLSPYSILREGEKIERRRKLMGQDKAWEIPSRLPSRTKQTGVE